MDSHLLRQNSFGPEVFETPDPAPLETKIYFPQNTTSNEDVEEKSVSRREVFQKFLGAAHSQNPHASAYLWTSDPKQTWEYSVHKGSRGKLLESPLERYNRLRAEVDDFMRDLQLLESESGQQFDSELNPGELLKNMRILERDLNDAIKPLQNVPNSESLKRNSVVQASETIKSTLENVRAMQSNPNQHVPASMGSGASTFVNLEERIAKLEGQVGAVTLPEGMSNYHDLASALHEKLTLIADPSRLDALRQRVVPLVANLESLAKARATGHKSSQDIDARVIQAFEILESWEKYTDSLPILVQRLTTLQEIHSNASKVVAQVSEMDRKHQQLQQLLQDNHAALNQLSASFQENAKLMQTNSEILESRMEKVLARLEKQKSG